MSIKTKKYIAFFLLFFVIGGFVVGAIPEPAKAQGIVTVDTPSIFGLIWDKLGKVWDKINSQMLATAFKQSLGTFLNKLAYDSAVYVAAGGTGQKGLVNPFSKKALQNLGEAVAGEFIDELAQKSGLVGDPEKLAECVKTCPKNAQGVVDATCTAGCKQSTAGAFGTYSLCEPVDLTTKANLLMSFKKPKEPPTPKCSLTKMKQAAQKSAQDNLLEFNAGYQESEGGLNITLQGLTSNQIFQGTDAQKALTANSEDLIKFLTELNTIMTSIQTAFQNDSNNAASEISGGNGVVSQENRTNILASESSAQAVADGQLEEIKALRDDISGISSSLEQIMNNYGDCSGEYNKNGSNCGNGIVTTGEQCDVKAPFCSACRIAGGAGNDCGNPPNEQCNGADLRGQTCQTLGFIGGGTGLTCDSSCHFDTSGNKCNSVLAGICTDASLMPHCAMFTNIAYPETAATSCLDNAALAGQYGSQLFGLVALELQQVEDFIKKIEDRVFADVVNNDPSDIANAFNPEANEMGQFGKIQETLSQKTQDQLEHEKLKTLAEGPCKGVTKPITGEVVTPSAATCAAINEALAKSTKGQETFTGTFADAFGVFVNTLTSKLMERYFKKGLSLVFDKDGLQGGAGNSECTSWEDTKDEDKADKSVRDLFTSKRKKKCADKTEDILRSGASLGGKAAAEKALGDLLNTSTESGGQQDILSILAACPPEQPALNNCIIDEPLRRAIERQYTVKEAIEAYKKSGGSEGLDPKKPFGYIIVGAAMDEPDFKNGYPYRSMLYLRKYRIIPIGWELAAQYIKDIEATKQVHTLDSIVDGFEDPNSPFFGLVDPAWVLKAPAVFCARQGPGPELLSTELMCEKMSTGSQCVSDDYQARKVSRKEWCADEQTCLEEGENGDCKRYGYCTLEKPSWKLGGTQCEKPFASCDGYTNSITKANYTVLENTLNKTDCNQSNVGCQWYCQDAPKMCKGGTRGGQPCGVNNDCASVYCSVGKCVSSGIACSYDNDCGSGATGFCSNNSATSCTTATVGTDCGAGIQCILCNTGAHACVNGDTPGAACTTNAGCGRGVVDGVCEEGGVWSCKEENLVADGDMESTDVSNWDDGSLEGCNNASYLKSTSIVHSGTRALQLTNSGLVLCQGAGQAITLEVGKTYTLEAWVKSDGGFTNGVIFNPMGPTNFQWYNINPSSEWQHVSKTFIATNISMSFGFRIPGASTTAVYIDDVKLYEGDRVNLDRDVKKCEAKDAGCNQFIKVAPGTNLIGNSGFEDDADLSPQFLTIIPGSDGYANRWYLKNSSPNPKDLKAEINHGTVHSGKNSLYIEMDSDPLDFTQGLWMDDSTSSYSVVPSGFLFDSEKSYTISAWVYIDDAATGKISLTAGSPFLPPVTTTQTSSQWERISLTISAGTPVNEIRIYPTAGPNPTRFYIDDLQLEESDMANNYVQYGSSNQAYLNGRRLQCEKQEVGCNLYTPSEGGDPIPAVIKIQDQCPAECAGYAPFYQMPSFFEPTDDPSDYPNIIPASGVSCPASSMGCEEFTNLDTVASGGEAKEYYTKLRQCAKPGTTTEATYYTWEGSEEAGFQLRAWRLKADADGSPTSLNGDNCLDSADPDCRTFYDQNGITFSEELSSTVFISADCHPLRKTIQGTREDCLDSGGRTETPGIGDDDIVVCLYDAIPSQGLKCAAAEAGCREYRGSAGNNLRVLLNDDFEDLTSQGWTPSSLSSESLTIGGRSYVLKPLLVDGLKQSIEATKSVADLITQDKTYMLEFWAKPKFVPAGITTTINARFFGFGTSKLYLQDNGITISGDWNKYALGPLPFISRPPAVDETLEFIAKEEGATPDYCDGTQINADCAAEFYLDNIVLREITDNPYLIKDSWKTPLSCDLDPNSSAQAVDTIDDADGITALEVGSIVLDDSLGFTNGGMVVVDGEAIQYDNNATSPNLTGLTRGMRGTAAASHSDNAEVWLLDEGAQLGCKEYTDRFNQKTYLRSFDMLCGEDKVGCTEMINTYNSRSMYDQTIKGEYIPRDAVEYIVDNPKLYCNASFKGCEKLGQPALGQSGEVSSWGETYLINDPDQYAQIACESSENMCSEFTTRTGGTTYFKDPKDALCEYHSSINIEGIITKGWFKKGVIPAALGGLIFYDSDGDSANDTYAHLECATTSGAWDETKWTYSCPNDQVGCTEFQTPAVSTRQDGNQYIGVVNIDTSNAICFPNTAPPSTQYCKTTPTIPSPASWQYRFDVLESGQYNLALSTQNYLGGDAFVAAPLGYNRHHLNIYIDGVLKKALISGTCSLAGTACYANSDCLVAETCNNVSSPLPPQASPSVQSTMVNLGTIERGKRIVSIEWANDWLGAIEDSNLQINSLILSKSAGVNYYNLEQGVDTSSCTGVVDPEKGCVAFYDATNPILNIKSSAISGNAFAPAACQKCSLDAASCSTLTACDPASENCCCTNNSAVTNPCDSNTILKVMADRQCAEWLACTESEKTTDSKGNMIEMCKKRQACYKTGDGVECASDGLVAETKQNQTFDNPVAVDVPATHASIIADANLRSGFFKAGAHWTRVCQNNTSLSCQVDADCGTDGPCIDRQKMVCSLDPNKVCATNLDCSAGKGICGAFIEGYYPYAKMEQVGLLGIDPIIFEDDFETYQAGVALPQCSADASACPCAADKGICLDYWLTGSAKATNKEFKFGGQSLLVLDSNTDLAKISSKNIFVNTGSPYVFTVWLNTKDLQGTDSTKPLNRLVAQVDIAGVAKATVVQEESSPWVKYVIPISGADVTVGTVNIRIYMENKDLTNPIKGGSKAYVDMISLAPVLEIQSPSDARSLPENYAANGTAYSDRSCRIFAKPDALSCKYRERNTGREIQGWRGFCAEADPKNPEYCLQWWPIDLIKGEDISKF